MSVLVVLFLLAIVSAVPCTYEQLDYALDVSIKTGDFFAECTLAHANSQHSICKSACSSANTAYTNVPQCEVRDGTGLFVESIKRSAAHEESCTKSFNSKSNARKTAQFSFLLLSIIAAIMI